MIEPSSIHLSRRGLLRSGASSLSGAFILASCAGAESKSLHMQSKTITQPPTTVEPPPPVLEPERAWLTLPPTPSLSAPSKSGIAHLDGAQIYYAEYGTGQPVLMRHGGLANSNYWGHQVPEIAQRFRVIVMDTRGHGRSTNSANSMTYDRLAKDVLGVLDVIGVRDTTIVGWSDGAIVGLYVAMKHPSRIRGLFSFGANYSLSGTRPGGSSSSVFSAYVRRTEQEYRQLSPDPSKYKTIRSLLDEMWRHEPNYLPKELQTIKARTTVADGEYDEIILRDHTKSLAAAIPNSSLVIERGVSHFAMLQNPQLFTQDLMTFLTNA